MEIEYTTSERLYDLWAYMEKERHNGTEKMKRWLENTN